MLLAKKQNQCISVYQPTKKRCGKITIIIKKGRTKSKGWAVGTMACGKEYSLLYCLQCSILSSLFQPGTCKPDSVPKPSSSSSCLCNVLALFCWAVKKTGLEMQLFSQVFAPVLTIQTYLSFATIKDKDAHTY